MRVVSPSLRSTDVATLLAAAWRWWLAELAGLLPASLLARLRARRANVLVDLGTSEIVVARVRGGVHSELLRLPYGATKGDGEAIAAGLRRVIAAGEMVTLRLPAPEVLRKTVELPLGAARNLPKILQFELDRQSPLEPGQIYFDHHVVRRDKSANRLTVELRIVKRDLIDRALSACQSLDVPPNEVCFTGEKRPFKLAGAVAGRRLSGDRKFRRWVIMGLGALACVLFVAILSVDWLRARDTTNAVAARLAEVKAQAQEADRLREQVKHLADVTGFLPSQKAKPMLAEILAEVTRILPDGTWLLQLEMQDREIRAIGYSPIASELIRIFDASPLFTNTRFRAPLTQGPKSGLERFDLSFELKGVKP